MRAPSPILLPCGLSRDYMAYLRGEPDPPNQYGPLRFRIASLSELRALSRSYSKTLPPLAPSITASAAHQHRIERPKNAIRSKRNKPRIDLNPGNGQTKHRRSKKRLKLSASALKTSEEGIRPGASHDAPIILDSDSSESATSVSSYDRLRSDRGITSSPVRPTISIPDSDRSRNQHQNSSTCSHQKTKSVTAQNSHASSGFSLRSSNPAQALHSLTESSSSESETPLIPSNISRHLHGTDQIEHTFKTRNSRPTNMRDGRKSGAFSRTKPKTPGPWQYRHLHTKSESRREFPTTPSEMNIPSSQPPGRNDNVTNGEEKDMTLLDIDDFELRSKVAHLMAVAPALPVTDLYHLVINSKGRMSTAKKRARNMSEAPSASHTFTQSTFAGSRKIVEDDDKDENVMVKIDPDSPTFEWDDDEPTPQPTSIFKDRPSKTDLRHKNTNCNRSPLATRPTKRTKTSEISSHPGTKRSKLSSSNRNSQRETSSDRDFIVADNVIEYALDSDESYEFDTACYTPGKKRVLPRRKYSMI